MRFQFDDPMQHPSKVGISPKEAKDTVKRIAFEQSKMLNVGQSGKTIVSKEFEKHFEEGEKEIIDYMTSVMAERLAAKTLQQIMENLSFVAHEGKQGFGSGAGFLSGAEGGTGYFLEEGWFGESKGNDPRADLQAINTELKHLRWDSKDIKVGNITLRTKDKEYNSETLDYIMIAYKMYAKMRNLLLFRTAGTFGKGSLSGEGSNRFRTHYIKELTLFYELIFAKLFKELVDNILGNFSTTRGGNLVASSDIFKITKKPMTAQFQSWGETQTVHKINYEIYLKTEKASSVYKFAELYLKRINLLKEVKNNTKLGKTFFWLVRHKKELNKVKNIMFGQKLREQRLAQQGK